MPSIASKTILDELVIEAKRNSRGGCTVYGVLPMGREVFIADVNVMGPKRALIEAQRNPFVVRELVKLTAEAKRIRAENARRDAAMEDVWQFSDDPEVALYLSEQDDDLHRAAAELGIDLSDVGPTTTRVPNDIEREHDYDLMLNDPVLGLPADECDAPGDNFVIESDPYVTA